MVRHGGGEDAAAMFHWEIEHGHIIIEFYVMEGCPMSYMGGKGVSETAMVVISVIW